MTSKTSNIYFRPDNLIMFGDYNIKILIETGKQLLNNFTAENGFSKWKKATYANRKNCLESTTALFLKNQIFEAYIIESIFQNIHFTIVYQSSFKLECKQHKTENLRREERCNTKSEFNRDIALQDWLIETYVQHLTIIQNKFSRISPFQKNIGNLFKKINSNKQTEKIAKLKEGHNAISVEKKCWLFEYLFCPSWILQGQNNCS